MIKIYTVGLRALLYVSKICLYQECKKCYLCTSKKDRKFETKINKRTYFNRAFHLPFSATEQVKPHLKVVSSEN
jgi:hypothetical protein